MVEAQEAVEIEPSTVETPSKEPEAEVDPEDFVMATEE